MSDGLTLEQIRTLLAVADAGSFSAAARELGRVQAAVSQSIARLESELGLRLFDRSSRTPRLTTRGLAIVAQARRVAGEVEQFDAFVAQLKGGAEHELSIVFDSMFPSEALVDFVRLFNAAHPEVELTLHTETLSGAVELVRDKRATLGVAGTEQDLSELVQKHMLELPMLPVAAPSHPLAKLSSAIDEEELSRHVQIVLRDRSDEKLRPTPSGPGILSTKTWQVVDLATKHVLLLGGLGWGHAPEPSIREELSQGRLVQLRLTAWQDRPPIRSLALIHREKGVLGPVAESASNLLGKLCQHLNPRAAPTP